jgi:hypothetical protein
MTAVFIVVVTSSPAGSAQNRGPWFGTWHLDVERSTYAGSAPYRRARCVIEPWNDGLKSVCEMVRVRGGVTHLEWAGRFDGKDYPVQGVEEYVTYAYTPRNERGYDVVIRLDGREAGRSRVTVSEDGRTMTVVTWQGREETRSVYRRDVAPQPASESVGRIQRNRLFSSRNVSSPTRCSSARMRCPSM